MGCALLRLVRRETRADKRLSWSIIVSVVLVALWGVDRVLSYLM